MLQKSTVCGYFDLTKLQKEKPDIPEFKNRVEERGVIHRVTPEAYRRLG